MKDLTKGKPSTLILAFALPIFFANLLAGTFGGIRDYYCTEIRCKGL